MVSVVPLDHRGFGETLYTFMLRSYLGRRGSAILRPLANQSTNQPINSCRVQIEAESECLHAFNSHTPDVTLLEDRSMMTFPGGYEGY